MLEGGEFFQETFDAKDISNVLDGTANTKVEGDWGAAEFSNGGGVGRNGVFEDSFDLAECEDGPHGLVVEVVLEAIHYRVLEGIAEDAVREDVEINETVFCQRPCWIVIKLEVKWWLTRQHLTLQKEGDSPLIDPFGEIAEDRNGYIV